MKAIILILCISMFTFSTFAVQSIPPIESILKQEINYPEFAKETSTEGTVLISLTIDENGKVCVRESNSDNEGLREYVINKLNNLIMPLKGQSDEEINIKFVFKLF